MVTSSSDGASAARRSRTSSDIPAGRGKGRMRHIRQNLSIARGEQPAEFLFKDAQLVNVLSGEIHSANVAVEDGRIVGIGDYKGRKTIDLRGAYLAPSLIDGHFHLE